MSNPFVATWIMNVEESQFDPNHRPRGGTMIFALGDNGKIVMQAEGINDKGERCAERPQTFIPDGKPHPVPDFPGLTAITTCPNPNTIEGEVRREDGTVIGKGVYTVSSDGGTLTAATSGFDSQLREFTVRTVWNRQ